MATKTFKGRFINDHTFVDENGNEIELIPSVLEKPDESETQSDAPSSDSDEFEWDGPTKEKENDIEEPDPDFTYIDDETGMGYQWDPNKKEFYEVGKID